MFRVLCEPTSVGSPSATSFSWWQTGSRLKPTNVGSRQRFGRESFPDAIHFLPRLNREPDAPDLYAAACRATRGDREWLVETWFHPLQTGRPLPTLPLWLSDDLAVPLELETSYEETCRVLRLT